MHIETVAITGCRCFDPNHEANHFGPGLAGLVGANSSGNMAILQALMWLFEIPQTQRTITDSDFHVAPAESERSKLRTLTIDVQCPSVA